VSHDYPEILNFHWRNGSDIVVVKQQGVVTASSVQEQPIPKMSNNSMTTIFYKNITSLPVIVDYSL
jgi:hypothetical protein